KIVIKSFEIFHQVLSMEPGETSTRDETPEQEEQQEGDLLHQPSLCPSVCTSCWKITRKGTHYGRRCCPSCNMSSRTALPYPYTSDGTSEVSEPSDSLWAWLYLFLVVVVLAVGVCMSLVVLLKPDLTKWYDKALLTKNYMEERYERCAQEMARVPSGLKDKIISQPKGVVLGKTKPQLSAITSKLKAVLRRAKPQTPPPPEPTLWEMLSLWVTKLAEIRALLTSGVFVVVIALRVVHSLCN
ncbi:hypothetical protein OTU49_007914, partial [Cherax quadricarinatus]